MHDPSSPSSSLLASENQGDNAPAQSVSELSGALKRTVEDRFGNVRVRGEISGFKRAASGHCYFSLKDDKAVIDSVLWKGSAARLAFAPEDGAEVIASGKLTTYPGRSKYQIVVEKLELAGEGALMALLEKRKRALAAEGLFAAERKKPLPYLPRVIGVVTSPTGAVIRDILHRLEERCPTHVIVWPVVVQGESAAGQVAAAINGFDALATDGPVPRPDLLIVARGGGSIEDLWAFNEEVVVRAAADCTIPLISAVGHETDTTLIDHAADKRAPTPTAAAEIAVPVLADLAAYVAEQGRRAGGRMTEMLTRRAERLHQAAERLPGPTRLLERAERRHQEAARGLMVGLRQRAQVAEAALGRVAARHRPEALRRRVDREAAALDQLAHGAASAPPRRSERASDRLSALADRLSPALVERRLGAAEQRLDAAWKMALLTHPERPLEKGYAMVSAEGAPITSAASASQQATMTLQFADGRVDVNRGAAPRPAARVAKRAKPAYPRSQQRDLFGGDEDSGV